MLVENYSSMKDSGSHCFRKDLKDDVEWIKWMKYLFVQGTKESTLRSSDKVAKFCFPEIRLPLQS